ncbi:uncharacterized protein [Amphiura filiformis]|uniref:uncharacterized protein n=1 Tax=Amphiura filiformis TaxID=82378 RepID=UPI003B218876
MANKHLNDEFQSEEKMDGEDDEESCPPAKKPRVSKGTGDGPDKNKLEAILSISFNIVPRQPKSIADDQSEDNCEDDSDSNSEGGSSEISESTPSKWQEIVDKKWTQIEELMKDIGCDQCTLQDKSVSESGLSLTLSLVFTELEGLNKFNAAAGGVELHSSYTKRRNLTYTGWHRGVIEPPRITNVLTYKQLMQNRLEAILFSDNSEDVQTCRIDINHNHIASLKQAVKFFQCVESPLRLRDDLPEEARQEEINWNMLAFAKQDNSHKVQECLDLGADVNYYGGPITHEQATALHWAVARDHIQTCQVLLKAPEVNVNLKIHRAGQTGGKTALFFAGSKEVCDLLLSSGAKVDVTDEAGWTPLQHAVADDKYSVEVVKSLIKAKSDVNKKYPDGHTLFTVGLGCDKREGLKDKLEALKTKADIELTGKDGLTPLLAAVSALDIEMTKLLLQFGANIHATDKDGLTPLLAAVSALDIEMTKLLLQFGANIHATDKEQNSVLHRLAMVQKEDRHSFDIHKDMICIFNELLKYHAEVTSVNKKQCTITNLLILNHGTYELAELHTLHAHLLCPVILATPDENEDTLLHIAAGEGLIDTCQILISHGAKINRTNKAGNTPLHLACGGVWTCLLQSGANLLVMNHKKETPLHMAVKQNTTSQDYNRPYDYLFGDSNNLTFCQTLLREDPFINARDGDGNTPLHKAAEKRNRIEFKLLMEHGANALIRNKAGEQPLDLYGDHTPRELVELVQKQRKEELMLEGETKLDTVKVLLLGEPAAGKTTLTKGITDEDPAYTPTAGIDIDEFSLEGAGNFSIWDCAGHEEFHVTHSLFLEGDNTIFLVVYDLSVLTRKKKAKERYYEKLKYWLCFAKAGIRQNSTKPTVLLVGTHLDQVSTKTNGKKAAQGTVQALQDLFKEFLNISDCTIALNTKKKDSEEMACLKSQLGVLGSQIKVKVCSKC